MQTFGRYYAFFHRRGSINVYILSLPKKEAYEENTFVLANALGATFGALSVDAYL